MKAVSLSGARQFACVQGTRIILNHRLKRFSQIRHQGAGLPFRALAAASYIRACLASLGAELQPTLHKPGSMVVIGTGPLQGTPCLKQCTKPSLQRAPVSRRRIVALAAPSTKHRPAAEEREEHHSSSPSVEAGRTAEAVRSFDDGAQSRGISVQSAANLVRICIHILLAQDTACFADRPALL